MAESDSNTVDLSRTAANMASTASVAPHPVLSDYYTEEAKRREFLDEIFEQNAGFYDRNEKLLGFGTGSWYRRQALKRAGLKPGMRVIDVGFGTGLVAREALKIVGDPRLVIGVDPSPNMMAQAELPKETILLNGSAEAIPQPDESADFLSMGFALRHVSSLEAAFSEYMRVLRPGASLCLLEITPPEKGLWRWLLRNYMSRVVPTIVRVISKQENSDRFWQYYWETVAACVPPAAILAALEAVGFEDANRHVEVGIFSEYRARKPD